MLKLIKYLEKYKLETGLSPLFKLIEASFELMVPMVVASIIDVGIARSDKIFILNKGLILCALSISGLIFSIIGQYYAAKASVGFGTELRNAIFKHINELSIRDLQLLGNDTLINRVIGDTTQVQTGVNLFFRLVLRSPFIVLGALIMAFSISTRQSLIFVGVIGILSLIIYFVMKGILKRNATVKTNLDLVLSRADENLSGARVLRAFLRTDEEKKEFKVFTDRLFDSQMKVGELDAILNPVTLLIVNLAIILILYKGAFDVYAGRLSAGHVVALVNYMSQILVELIKLVQLVILLSKASTCAKRIDEIFATKTSIEYGNEIFDTGLKKGDDLLVFENVSFAYPDKKSTLENISFSMKKGENIGIIGVTGSGKSTLARLIVRFYDIDSGNIRLCSKNIKSYSKEALLNFVGMAEQQIHLFKGSIKDNIAWGKAADKEVLEKSVEAAQAKDIIKSKAQGYDTLLEEGGKNLSGGQRQRLSIARALYHKPKLLILDDVSSALDYITELNLRKSLESIEDMNFIIISQRVSSIMNLDKIIVIDEGNIAAIGSHKELLEKSQLYKEICSTQLAQEG